MKAKTFLLIALLCTIAQEAWTASAFGGGNGSEETPYIISSAEHWDQLATDVDAGTTYLGKYFRMDDNISVTTMIGTSTHRFGGYFDGNAHTLTVSYNTTEQYTAPFRYVEGAKISNLHVDGNITVSEQFAGGVIANSMGATITNCRISVRITSNIGGDGTHGGLVAHNISSPLIIEGCVFDGFMMGGSTRNCAGFVGWT